MTRWIALTLVIVAVALAGSAAAKEPVPAPATAVLAIVGSEIEQPKLVWLNPRTLKRLKLGSVPLGDYAGAVFSPTGGRVAVGGSGVGIRLVDVFRMKVLSKMARRGSQWDVAPIAWPSDRRLLAFETHQRLPQRALIVVDPVARRVLRRMPIDGFSSFRAVGREAVILLEPAEGIGPARLLVVDSNGEMRSVTLDRIPAGGKQEGSEDDPVWRMAAPGLAVDPVAHRAYVVGNEPLLANVDLDSLSVTYRGLTQPKRGLSVRDKSLLGWSRQAEWLGEGRLAVTGSDYARFQSSPAGLRLVDVNDGTSRLVDAGATFALDSTNTLLATGAWTDGSDSWSGMGVAAYGRDGRRMWHVLAGEPVSWLQSTGGYAYVPGPDVYPSTTRIIQLATGVVRTARQVTPFFVTP